MLASKKYKSSLKKTRKKKLRKKSKKSRPFLRKKKIYVAIVTLCSLTALLIFAQSSDFTTSTKKKESQKNSLPLKIKSKPFLDLNPINSKNGYETYDVRGDGYCWLYVLIMDMVDRLGDKEVYKNFMSQFDRLVDNADKMLKEDKNAYQKWEEDLKNIKNSIDDMKEDEKKEYCEYIRYAMVYQNSRHSIYMKKREIDKQIKYKDKTVSVESLRSRLAFYKKLKNFYKKKIDKISNSKKDQAIGKKLQPPSRKEEICYFWSLSKPASSINQPKNIQDKLVHIEKFWISENKIKENLKKFNMTYLKGIVSYRIKVAEKITEVAQNFSNHSADMRQCFEALNEMSSYSLREKLSSINNQEKISLLAYFVLVTIPLVVFFDSPNLQFLPMEEELNEALKPSDRWSTPDIDWNLYFRFNVLNTGSRDRTYTKYVNGNHFHWLIRKGEMDEKPHSYIKEVRYKK